MTVATPERFFQAATMLLSNGRSALTLSALCAATSVSTGSFYHHFRSWDCFVERYLENWDSQWTQRIVEASRQRVEPHDRLDELFRLAVDVPHTAECAIRAWANIDTVVAAAQARVDAARLEYGRELLSQLIDDPDHVERLAVLLMASFVGVQLLKDHLGEGAITAVLHELRTLVQNAATPPSGSNA